MTARAVRAQIPATTFFLLLLPRPPGSCGGRNGGGWYRPPGRSGCGYGFSMVPSYLPNDRIERLAFFGSGL
ncbi:hypothetical protein GCM10010343_50610 [Streptomyces avidinii]|nr:hypothetical protein GCM10010343_50610 [Streptomyces avidinii]